MASGLSGLVLLAFGAMLAAEVFADDNVCLAYTDLSGMHHPYERCFIGFCCGMCTSRQCCTNSFLRLSEDSQEECEGNLSMKSESLVGSVIGVGIFVFVVLISCCLCPCCCLYKMCRKPRPVVATTTHTTVVTTTPQHYPRQPTASPGQPHPYQAAPYPAYQPIPIQPGYGTQPMPQQGYGPQPMPTMPQPMSTMPQPMPTMPHPGQPFTPGPPPTYQEATGPPAFPPNPMPYSQAAFSPGQPSYPLQPPPMQPHPMQPPPMQPQAHAPPAQPDYLAQPAYNPDFVSPPPKTG
ncbi:protein shisa-4-like isoform X1 [Entelurus aequoreus]|uniref:protein shisa-4-like isoform X1 n=1 Tax=Entelurus aequoreus TaxID=161455 RepID=UPI002B1CEDBF|nr:protein shisa-4-like isoform X1 [Entelurus aequoreus]